MSRSKWYRLILSVLLFSTFLWLWSTRFDELSYHTWGKTDLIDVGDALLFDEVRDKIPPNSYVSVSGILGNKAATLRGLRAGSFRYGRYQVRHLLGSKLYVEYDEAKYHPIFRPFMRVSVKGRLIPFGPGSELEKVRMFFKEHYHQTIDEKAMLVVVDEEPRSEFIYWVLFLLSCGLIGFSFYSSARFIGRRESEDENTPPQSPLS